MVEKSYEDDLELLRGCLANDRRLQKELYKKYFKTMFQICLSYSGDRVEAKDILQEAFIKVFTNLEKFNAANSLEGWIRRIVTNTVNRKQKCSDFGKKKYSHFGNNSAVILGTILQ